MTRDRDEVLLEQLAALAREEEANVRALESQLEPIDMYVERTFQALMQGSRVSLGPASFWHRMRHKLGAWHCVPLLFAVSAILVLYLSLSGLRPPRADVKLQLPTYRLSVHTGAATMTWDRPLRASGLKAPALRAGSTVKLVLHPVEQTTVVPRAKVVFDDGTSTLQCESDTAVEPDGSMELLVAIPDRAGQLRIVLEPMRSQLAAAGAAGQRCAGDQAWSLPVQLASAPAREPPLSLGELLPSVLRLHAP